MREGARLAPVATNLTQVLPGKREDLKRAASTVTNVQLVADDCHAIRFTLEDAPAKAEALMESQRVKGKHLIPKAVLVLVLARVARG